MKRILGEVADKGLEQFLVVAPIFEVLEVEFNGVVVGEVAHKCL